MKKKNNTPKNSKGNSKPKKTEISMHMFSMKPLELELNDKKVKAIKTIMDDPILRFKESEELRALMEGYQAGKKKGDKK